MKGYKAFNEDLTCRDFQYEIGKEYVHEGEIEPCESGFHFCKSIADCYNFYATSDSTRICEVEATGNVKKMILESNFAQTESKSLERSFLMIVEETLLQIIVAIATQAIGTQAIGTQAIGTQACFAQKHQKSKFLMLNLIGRMKIGSIRMLEELCTIVHILTPNLFLLRI